jgi:hypothetical protein
LIPDDVNTLVTTAGAATIAGVSVATIRSWRLRGHLDVAGLTETGRPMYRWIDVAKAERHTRDRARRTYAA